MNTGNNLNNPDLTPEEEDALVGAFVRRQAREELRERWSKQLELEHGVTRGPVEKSKTVGLPPRPARLRQLIYGVVAAAAAAVLLLVFLPRFNGPSPGELTAAMMRESPVDNLRGDAGSTLDSLRVVARRQVAGEDFAGAASTGRLITGLPEHTSEDILYQGYIELNAGAAGAAETSFRQVLNNGVRYRTKATFYLALSLYVQGETEEAKKLLGTITAEDGTTYYGKARDLLSAW